MQQLQISYAPLFCKFLLTFDSHPKVPYDWLVVTLQHDSWSIFGFDKIFYGWCVWFVSVRLQRIILVFVPQERGILAIAQIPMYLNVSYFAIFILHGVHIHTTPDYDHHDCLNLIDQSSTANQHRR